MNGNALLIFGGGGGGECVLKDWTKRNGKAKMTSGARQRAPELFQVLNSVPSFWARAVWWPLSLPWANLRPEKSLVGFGRNGLSPSLFRFFFFFFSRCSSFLLCTLPSPVRGPPDAGVTSQRVTRNDTPFNGTERRIRAGHAGAHTGLFA